MVLGSYSSVEIQSVYSIGQAKNNDLRGLAITQTPVKKPSTLAGVKNSQTSERIIIIIIGALGTVTKG